MAMGGEGHVRGAFSSQSRLPPSQLLYYLWTYMENMHHHHHQYHYNYNVFRGASKYPRRHSNSSANFKLYVAFHVYINGFDHLTVIRSVQSTLLPQGGLRDT